MKEEVHRTEPAHAVDDVDPSQRLDFRCFF